MLPGLTGFEVLRKLRETSSVPVLMLTARGEDVDRIVGLEMGADDYLPKPFNPRELAARMRAVLRRASSEPETRDRLGVDDVIVDLGTRSVCVADLEISLTGVEFSLLEALIRSAGNVVSRDDLSRAALFRRASAFDRSLDVHISNLRRKLGPTEAGGERIKTIRGVGYQYVRRAGSR
jgi:two-component system response regulator CpxR